VSITTGEAGQQDPSLRARKKRKTRDRIYDTALALFAERPYDEVTVEEICERAEVGRATFFRFYGTKAGLLHEFGERVTEQVEERLDSQPDLTPTEQLWAVQEVTTLAWGLSSPATRAMAREWIKNTTAADLDKSPTTPELFAIVTDIVRSGQRTGEFTDGYEAEFVAWMIFAALAASTGSWLSTGDDDDLVHGTRDSIAFLLDGLRRATT
jgi:AcrR family transcriptional regulator